MFRFNAGPMAGLSSLVMLYAGVVVLATVVVPVIFAVAVLSDSPPRRVLAERVLWALRTVIGGPLVAGLYGLVHHGLPVHPYADDREYASALQP